MNTPNCHTMARTINAGKPTKG